MARSRFMALKGANSAAAAMRTLGVPQPGAILAAAKDTVEQTAPVAEEKMKGVIATTPPNSGDWSNFWRGPRQSASVREGTGRVDSGNMINSVKHAVKHGRGGSKAEIGWVGGDPEHYFNDQEYGFVWTPPDDSPEPAIPVSGMGAIYHSEREMEGEVLETLLDNLARAGLRGSPAITPIAYEDHLDDYRF